jgi:hypothetical protein
MQVTIFCSYRQSLALVPNAIDAQRRMALAAGTGLPARDEISRELGVRYTIQGGVSQVDTRLRVPIVQGRRAARLNQPCSGSGLAMANPDMQFRMA